MRARNLGIALLLLVATLAVYAQVRTHEFVNFDDPIYVTDNPNFQGGLTLANLQRVWTTPYAAYWIPLTWTSLLIDYQIHGTNPQGYLALNVLLHIVNSVLLYLLLARATNAPWRSAFVAAVFAVHPLHVESVAWVTERKDVLSVFFGLLALHAYVRRCERSSLGRSLAVGIAFALALLSKPSLVTLPVVMLLLDIWPLRRVGVGWKKLIVEKLPLFVMAAAIGIVALSTQASMGGMELSQRLSALTKTVNAFESLLMYLWTTVWPAGLAVVYPMPLKTPAPLLAILGASILVAVTVAVLWGRTARPYLLVGWFWFLMTLAPASGIVHVGVQARADRFMYFPLIGLSILVTWAACDLAGRLGTRPAVMAVIGVATLTALGVDAHRQVGYWKNTISLFERATSVTRENYFAHNRLAEQYKSQLRLDEAEAQYNEAIRIDPGWATPQLQLANLREARGDAATAGFLRDAAARVMANPEFAPSYVGVAWMQAGRYRLARPLLERAVAEHPEYVGVRNALAIVLSGLGENRQALEQLDQARRYEPDHPVTGFNRAWLRATVPDAYSGDPDRQFRGS